MSTASDDEIKAAIGLLRARLLALGTKLGRCDVLRASQAVRLPYGLDLLATLRSIRPDGDSL